ncbi:GtrA family protein [Nocardia cyriacigeorgica]|uniref:GtrA family protein n=1 Tax=Nocardia cyriacigeorgica TaxID=135487 RepID=UPI0020175CCE|nr:GtrA family protein [Nocardia cyriacigeorgica]
MSGTGRPEPSPPSIVDLGADEDVARVSAPVTESGADSALASDAESHAFELSTPPGAKHASQAPDLDSDSSAAADPGPLLRLVRRQELAFAIVGGFNTVLGIVLTVAWLAILGDGVPPSVAVVAAYCVSVVVAFVLHRTLVFRVRGQLLRDFLAFVAVNSGGLVMNVVLLELAVTVLGFPEKPAAVVVMGFVAVVSFFGHRHISFRRRVG